MKATIHFSRINKKEALYIEGLVRDDGIRLDTCTILPPEAKHVWTKAAWQAKGILASAETVYMIRKHHFYNEWFDIIEVLDPDEIILGYYCDITTPLRKMDGEYYVQDLLLDLWVFPDGNCIELDWDEFDAAVAQGFLSSEYQHNAVNTLRRLVSETQQGLFPHKYLLNSGVNDD